MLIILKMLQAQGSCSWMLPIGGWNKENERPIECRDLWQVNNFSAHGIGQIIGE